MSSSIITRCRLGAIAIAVAATACARTAHVETAPGQIESATPANANTLPAGTEMTARLNQSLGTKSSKVGDQFTATVTEAVVARNGQTVVPQGATLYGHVTGLQSANVTGDQAVIRLAFDSLMSLGRRYPFAASISSVAPAGKSTGSTDKTVRTAVTGAAAGAVLGAIVSGGDLDKILAGGLLGAAAGTVISLGRGDVESVIPEGSTLTIRSAQSLALH
jgi:hypothetical protein